MLAAAGRAIITWLGNDARHHALYLLSLSSRHRDAGRKFFSVPGLPNNAEIVGYEGLAQFNRISLVARPGLTIGWCHRDDIIVSASRRAMLPTLITDGQAREYHGGPREGWCNGE